mmetsp:Transcript_41925/g.82319  ORF Transcript_41925/g.82319 Transcript_41925/m.82319 type:complete len:235 (+) Transcript_41925:1785-2489(+)
MVMRYLHNLQGEMVAVGIDKRGVVPSFRQTATAFGVVEVLPTNLRELRDVRCGPHYRQLLVEAAPRLHGSEHRRRVPVSAVVIRPNQVPHDRARDTALHIVRVDNAGPTGSAVQIVVAAALLARPHRLPQRVARRIVVVAEIGRVVETDNVHGFAVGWIFSQGITDVCSSVFSYDLQLVEPSVIQGAPETFGVFGVGGALVPYSDVVHSDVVLAASSLHPLHDVVGRLVRVSKW